jgi:hypothetical protein
MESNVPNLDCEDSDTLWEFWKRFNSVRPVAQARLLFPDRPKGYVSAARSLAGYASNKATAMSCRIEGKIESALVYEKICDRIYSDLPDYAKW